MMPAVPSVAAASLLETVSYNSDVTASPPLLDMGSSPV